jgi:parallel beta-helix repeat protein
MKKIILISIMLFLLAIPLVSATDIFDCSNLDAEYSVYHLTTDIINSSYITCMNITANNIILDCQGHSINGQDVSDTIGINISYASTTTSNITVENCAVNDWQLGIYLKNVNNNTISNSIANSNTYGMTLEGSSNNLITNSITNNNSMGFSVYASSNNNQITNLTANGNTVSNPNQYGIFIGYYSNNNQIIGSTVAENNPFGIFLYVNANNNEIINTTVKNTVGNGIFVFTNCDNNTIKNSEIYGNTFGLNFHTNSNNNTIINSNFHDNSYGIILGSYYSETINTTVSNSIYGISIDNSYYNQVSGSTINNNTFGFTILDGSSNNTIYNNIIKDSGGNGIWIYAGSTQNKIYNNLFNNTNNTFSQEINETNYWNTTNQSGARVFSDGTNIGGNYYTNSTYNGFSDTCADIDHDGFCDNTYTLASDNIDYLPLSDNYSTTTTTTTTTTTSTTSTITIPTQSSYNNCYDNTTLTKHTFVNVTVNNQLKTIDWTENVVCPFGCDSVNNDCRPDTFFTILLTIIGLVAFVALLYWIYRKV